MLIETVLIMGNIIVRTKAMSIRSVESLVGLAGKRQRVDNGYATNSHLQRSSVG